MPADNFVHSVLDALGDVSIVQFLECVLSTNTVQSICFQVQLLQDLPTLFQFLATHTVTKDAAVSSSVQICTQVLMGEVARMASKQKGWHFNARNASAEQIEAFSIQEMATTLESETPHLWAVLGHLLSSDTVRERRRQNRQDRTDAAANADVQPDAWTDEDEYWANDLEGGVFGSEDMFAPNAAMDEHEGRDGPDAEGKTEGTKRQKRFSDRTTALRRIVSII
jgi:hypothetical protein